MISSATLKLIRSLRIKKYRDLNGLYSAEGEKIVLELIRGHPGGDHRVERVFATREWIGMNQHLLEASGIGFTEATPAQLKKASSLVTPRPVLALVNKPEERPGLQELSATPVLGFESIRDPGNLGSIIRTADWFGIRQIVCSPDSADLYNPKVVQATMGAIVRVKVRYLELDRLLKLPVMRDRPVYGTFLDGNSLFETKLKENPLFLFGNESRGLGPACDPYLTARITIPSFGDRADGSESLNLAASVAVVCAEIRRR